MSTTIYQGERTVLEYQNLTVKRECQEAPQGGAAHSF